jgi:hypothetical protein
VRAKTFDVGKISVISWWKKNFPIPIKKILGKDKGKEEENNSLVR